MERQSAGSFGGFDRAGQWECLRGYAKGLHAVPLFPLERLACEIVLVRYVLQFRKMGGLAENVLNTINPASADDSLEPVADVAH